MDLLLWSLVETVADVGVVMEHALIVDDQIKKSLKLCEMICYYYSHKKKIPLERLVEVVLLSMGLVDPVVVLIFAFVCCWLLTTAEEVAKVVMRFLFVVGFVYSPTTFLDECL